MNDGNNLKDMKVIEAIELLSTIDISLTFVKYLNLGDAGDKFERIKYVLDNFELLEYLVQVNVPVYFYVAQHDNFAIVNDGTNISVYIPASLKNKFLDIQDDKFAVLSIVKSFIKDVYDCYDSHIRFLESKISDVIS